MSVITTLITRTIDLDRGVGSPKPIGPHLVYGNKHAHRFQLICTRAGAPADLTGARCMGYVRRPDGATVPLQGTVEGNIASITLTASCYSIPGRVTISMELTQGDTRATHALWLAQVERTTTDTVSGEAVLTVGEYLDRSEAAAENAEAAAARAEATDAGVLAQRLDNFADASLSQSGLAADAAVTGQRLDQLDQLLSTIDLADNTDLDTIKTNGMYYCIASRTYPNSPDPSMGLLTVYRRSNGIVVQDWVNADTGARFARYFNSTWSAWKNTIHASVLVNRGAVATDADFNTLVENGVYYAYTPASHLNSPNGKAGVLTVTVQNSVITQDFCCIIDGSRYMRYSGNKGSTWHAWQNAVTEDVLRSRGGLEDGTDLDGIRDNGMYYLYASRVYPNSPVNSTVLLTVFDRGDGFVVQDCVNPDSGARYTRYYSAAWTKWRQCVPEDIRDDAAVYYAFGDSTTYGQIAVTGGRSKYNYPACVGRKLGMTVRNKAVGGQGLLKDWDAIHTNYLDGLDMSDAKLITIGWAYNDSANYKTMNFGAYTDTTPNTVIGSYYTIMKEFQEKCPQAQIILVTGYGMGGSYPQFKEGYNFLDKVHRVQELYDTLEEMCRFHGWCCVNQARGTWVTKTNWSTWIGDSIHPTNEGYLHYGNFMAAKIAGLYANLKAW